MILIGIHGAIGHGKTTLADIFTETEPNSIHLESSQIIIEVLNAANRQLPPTGHNEPVVFLNKWFEAFPAILRQVVHVNATPDQLTFTEPDVARNPPTYQKLFEYVALLAQNPELARATITADNKASYRAGLQGLGGYLISRVKPTIWYDELLRRAAEFGARDTKLAVIGGLRYPSDAEVVQSAGGVVIEITRPNMPKADLQDPTEKYREQITSDSVIINEGTLDQLTRTGKTVLADIVRKQLRPQYISSQTS